MLGGDGHIDIQARDRRRAGFRIEARMTATGERANFIGKAKSGLEHGAGAARGHALGFRKRGDRGGHGGDASDEIDIAFGEGGRIDADEARQQQGFGRGDGDAQTAAGRAIAAAGELRGDLLLHVDIGLEGVEGDGAERADRLRLLSETRQRLVESGFQLQIEGLGAFRVVCRLHGCHGVSACFARLVESDLAQKRRNITISYSVAKTAPPL